MAEENKDQVKENTKDQPLLNENGRPRYPRWVKNAEGVDVIVQTPDEEKQISVEFVGSKKPNPAKSGNVEGWDK